LPARFAETGGGELSADDLKRMSDELRSVTGRDLADLLLSCRTSGDSVPNVPLAWRAPRVNSVARQVPLLTRQGRLWSTKVT
jgi:hypothetical protein